MKTGKMLSHHGLSQTKSLLLVQMVTSDKLDLLLGKALKTGGLARWLSMKEGSIPPILARNMASRGARSVLSGFNKTRGVG